MNERVFSFFSPSISVNLERMRTGIAGESLPEMSSRGLQVFTCLFNGLVPEGRWSKLRNWTFQGVED
ncbi:hypothetical protein SLA2020_388480 [Shorea laevis]